MRKGRWVIVALAAVAVIAAASAFYMPRVFEAAWFLEDIAAGPSASSWKTLHRTPLRTEAGWTHQGRQGRGTLFTPDGERVRGHVIFVPGLLEKAAQDARSVAFAETLARAGYVTLLPELPAYDELKASPADIDAIEDAINYLVTQQSGVTQVGLVSLSYMSGPALLAAARPAAAPRVSFVFSIGGYASIENVVRFVTTRHFRSAGATDWKVAPDVPYATWAFLRANAEGIDDPDDRKLVRKIAEDRVAETFGGPKPDDAAAIAALGPEGRAVFDLVTNRDPEKVPELMSALPEKVKRAMAQLDLSQMNWSALQADVILVHGADDPLIPATESEKLKAALGDRAQLYLLNQVTHIEINRPGGIWDGLAMLGAARRLLSYRD